MRWLTGALLALTLGGCIGPKPRPMPQQGPTVFQLGLQQVRLDGQSLIYASDFIRERAFDDWEVESGSWEPGPHGVVGTSEHQGPAALWCTRPFPGDVIVRVWAQAVPPHKSDLNVYLFGTGTLDEPCLIAGTFGWWTSRHGLERHPNGPAATVRAGPMDPGHIYEIIVGRAGQRSFLLIDGQEVLTVVEGDPLPRSHDRIGLATWDASVRFHRVEVHSVDIAAALPPTDEETAGG
ncbi:MAG: hypothetical protein DRQ55_14420 [Planctomycetota bacterium]|nr:MAG: hypothetical protein DRQ55_14420 [Planctomycetota bacterium]